MRKIKAFLSVLALSLTLIAYGQTVTVTGNVKDATTGEEVPFAAVLVKGTTTGTAADAMGNYSISVPSEATLVFSSVGYVDQEIAVGGKRVINVNLVPDAEALEGTIVIGYGSAKKVASIVGSVTTVKSEVVGKTPSASALDALQGQVAGLAVLSSGGVSGDNNVSMTLHGTGSLGASSTPLFVIDGIPSSSGSVMSMNPNDIESVSVLKDASATSIYGSRAANGVVYVTTKGGSYNEKATITVRSQYGISTVADMGFYNSVMSGEQLVDFWLRAGLETPESINSKYFSKGYNHNTMWWKKFINLNNPQSQNDISIEGGGKNVAYLVSASQYHQDGTTVGNYYDRYTVRTNLQAHPKEWLKFGITSNLSYEKEQANDLFSTSGDYTDSNYLYGTLSIILNPLYPDELDGAGRYVGSRYQDPVFKFKNVRRESQIYSLNGSVYAEITPFKNFKLVSRAGTDAYFQIYMGTSNPSWYANNNSGSAGRAWYGGYTNTITNTAEYSLGIADRHKLTFLVGQEGVDYKYDTFNASSSGQTNDKQLRLQDGTQSTYSIGESFSQYRFLSFFGQVDYSLDNRFYANALIRRDYSSRFGRDNRAANFWAVGGKWNLTHESFIESDEINDLNLKVSYGTQGNAAIGNYNSLGLIGATTNYAEKQGWALAQPSNNALQWEKQGLLTVALTGRVLDRINFDVQYYNRKTTNMLMSVPYPYTAGFDEQYANVGGISNKGLDVTLSVDVLRTKDAYVTLSGTFNYNIEKVTELFNGLKEWTVANTGLTYVVGKPVSFYYAMYAGVNPETGAPQWYMPYGYEEYLATGDESCIDLNRTRLDPNAVTEEWSETLLQQNTGHKLNAPINGGFSIAGGWKGLSMRADFTYVGDKWLISNDYYFLANPTTAAGYNQAKEASDFWTPSHTNARYPDWSKYSMEFDSHLLMPASFLRLKNLQVGYSIPASLLKWQNVVKNVQITFTGRNLVTFTKFKGVDPEVDSNLVRGLPGNTKQVLGGVEIRF